MAKKTEAPKPESLNFKRLWNKRYSELVGGEVDKRATLTPEQVMNLMVQYFEWAELNAIKARETASFQGRVYQDTIHKPRIFTWEGLQLFCGFTGATLANWKHKPGYDVVVEFAASVIKEQKYQLAANGIINSTMIAKELGIDKGDTVNISANTNEQDNTEEAMKNAVASVLSKI
ncbi:TPA: terminase [Salmonella enterica]|nr:terminase [Salmonella enterica]